MKMSMQQGKHRPPGQGMGRKARRRRARREEAAAAAVLSGGLQKPSKASSAAKKWFLDVKGVSAPGLGTLKGFSAGSADPPPAAKRSARSEMVGLGMRTRKVQQVMPRMRSVSRGGMGAVDVLEGTEFLSSCNTSTSEAVPGDVLCTHKINPTSFPQTRLLQFAALYTRYRFRKLWFEYEPVASATQSGQIIGAVSYDVDEFISANDPNNVNTLASQFNEARTQIWEPRSWLMAIPDSLQSLYVDISEGDDRLQYQGFFTIVAASVIPASLALGNLYLRYEIEFSVPRLAPPTQAPNLHQTWTCIAPPQTTSIYGVPLLSATTSPVSGNGFDNTIAMTFLNNTVNFAGLPAGNFLMSCTFGSLNMSSNGQGPSDSFNLVLTCAGCLSLADGSVSGEMLPVGSSLSSQDIGFAVNLLSSGGSGSFVLNQATQNMNVTVNSPLDMKIVGLPNTFYGSRRVSETKSLAKRIDAEHDQQMALVKKLNDLQLRMDAIASTPKPTPGPEKRRRSVVLEEISE